jgi:hypothetical protein
LAFFSAAIAWAIASSTCCSPAGVSAGTGAFFSADICWRTLTNSSSVSPAGFVAVGAGAIKSSNPVAFFAGVLVAFGATGPISPVAGSPAGNSGVIQCSAKIIRLLNNTVSSGVDFVRAASAVGFAVVADSPGFSAVTAAGLAL